ncbi:putative Dolichyl-diphosphooligosaccharide--protein glycosyltransferase 48 kDa subunit precursor [Podospora australis]|uniref:Dolichyl-diphosphooligosaccharide--protein glycosyltransferase subunit WBP1 n=1 Tax=Podospora australis TaxID=1536484 RepID=A0AAN7AIJ6_9PEZI|nr:putative Dolichyl-diphosphooligosaccharide--protein glycosyltransferase 48 kDa subunit precursor [Podospora australis]
MMRSPLLSFFAFLFAALCVSAVSTTGNRVLAILDDVAEKAIYSKFLGDLEGRGFQLTFETPKSESLALFKLGERVYDHVIFFPTKTKGLGPNLTPNILVQFLNANGNILQTLSSGVSTPNSLVSFLSEVGIELPVDRTGLVVDHFSYDTSSAADSHDVLLLPPPAPIRSDIKNLFSAGAAKDQVLAFPRGVGAVLGSSENLTPILRAPRTAYSYNPKEQSEVVDDLFAAGQQLSLVSAFQALNSARLVLLGSAELLQDKWFDADVTKPDGTTHKTFNREFAKRLSAWAFQELGVLRVNWIEHRLNEVGGSNETNPGIYRIKNDVKYTISLSEYAYDKWSAFSVPKNDVLQLEFSMLSPFHRLPLKFDESHSSPEASAYSVSFKLPDQHGIFNFKVNYKRPLLSNMEEKNTVSVRHMAHDEWPRSFVISGAWPWIAGIGATVTGWIAFCALWMYSAPPADYKKESKKTQ